MSDPQEFVYRNAQQAQAENLKYKKKYKILKQQMKDMIFMNAALCDEVAEVQRNIVIASENRKFLAKRLMRHEGHEPVDIISKRQQKQQAKKAQLEQQQEKLTLQDTSLQCQLITTTTDVPDEPLSTEIDIVEIEDLPNETILDENFEPISPNKSFDFSLQSIGEILTENPNFHSMNFIYPVGYISKRIYVHPKNPMKKCVYTCKILNNEGKPQFQIIPDDEYDNMVVGDTPGVCHQYILKALQRNLAGIISLPLRVNGEKFFGLSHPSVTELLKLDPGYERLENFKGFCFLEEYDPTINFEVLQSYIELFTSNNVPKKKDKEHDEV